MPGMRKIRSYTYPENNPLKVTDWSAGTARDISNLYENIAAEKRMGRVSAFVDVSRNEANELIVEGMPNGVSLRDIADYLNLIGLAYEDLELPAGNPRKLG